MQSDDRRGKMTELVNDFQKPFSEPFTEEELAALIAQVEGHELIHAPAHLKGNVLRQIEEQRQAAKNRQLFRYRAQVLAGMAAALLMLFFAPMEFLADMPRVEVAGRLFAGEESGLDEWEKSMLKRRQDREKAWEDYCGRKEREAERKAHFQDIKNRDPAATIQSLFQKLSE